MRSASGGPRVLLRRLRETMAEQVSAQERLDKIVVLIAANMVAEVCSCYVLRVDTTLELYATEGLKTGAVHRATLTVGRGLVGLIAAEARALNLPDAQSHPSFAYLPETGEEIYHSFLGVPVLRAYRLRHDLAELPQEHARPGERPSVGWQAGLLEAAGEGLRNPRPRRRISQVLSSSYIEWSVRTASSV